MDWQATLVVNLIDAFLVCGVDDLESGKVVVRRSVVDGHCTHTILVNQSLGIENQNHIHKQSPCIAMPGDDMKGKLAGVFVNLLRKVGILVQHGLDHRPVLLLDVTEQFGLAGINNFAAGNRPTWRLGLLWRSLSLC